MAANPRIKSTTKTKVNSAIRSASDPNSAKSCSMISKTGIRLRRLQTICHVDIDRQPERESGDCLPTGNSPAFYRWTIAMFGLKKRKVERLDFIVPGAQKSGTTALRHFLSKHPHIALPDREELHFFDDEKIFAQPADYELLHRHFGPILSSTIVGELTPSYLYWKPAIERIRAYNRDIKL